MNVKNWKQAIEEIIESFLIQTIFFVMVHAKCLWPTPYFAMNSNHDYNYL